MLIFKQIWEESNKKCQLTDAPLEWIIPMSSYWFSCFAHILAKGKYPLMKYDADNIMLVHPQVHFLLDNGTHEQREKYIGADGMEIWNSKRDILLEKYKTLDKYM